MIEIQQAEKHVMMKEVMTISQSLDLNIYNEVIELVKVAMGAMYSDDYYIARFDSSYRKTVVFFDRFCFDFISLMGRNLFMMT